MLGGVCTVTGNVRHVAILDMQQFGRKLARSMYGALVGMRRGLVKACGPGRD